ncbi:MAG TPA: phosphatase PAP2 family protein [Gammaproteobacteria bacterium]|nr:phosphatase PAP2 family protein [Gammaproteobacteria bacterium]
MRLLITNLWIVLFLICALIFSVWPGIDLSVSHRFYDPARGFYLAQGWWPQFFYQLLGLKALTLVAAFGLLFTGAFFLRRNGQLWRWRIIYLFLVLLLGPGLVVNVLLKEHWGRARPHQIIQFGGTARFTPALEPAQECPKNCSFASGHAALGFYPLSLGFVFMRWRRFWLAAGMGIGGLAGYFRIIQGAHFLSDVVFAFFVVYGSAAMMHRVLRRRLLPAEAKA